MNVSKFLVLGALDDAGHSSGYDINRYLEKRMIHQWTDVKKASIYQALRALEKDAHVTLVKTAQHGAYPEKKIFAITPEGRLAFDALQHKAAMGLFPKFYGFKLALKFNQRLGPKELQALAKSAIQNIDDTIARMDAYLLTIADQPQQLALDSLFINHDRELFLVEKAWIQKAVDQLT